MTHIIGLHVYCPLCEQPMARQEVMISGKVATMFYCRPCNVGIYDFDPAFNKWRDADKAIPCPHCGKDLKWFARYMDGYFKAVCPGCGTKMAKDGDVKFKKSGAIVIPDEMESDEEPPVEVKIPFSKLKLGKDKLNALKNKMRNREEK
jgi:endogenous inhibitor of DNA gyrase (YacG/DUF329 family)